MPEMKVSKPISQTTSNGDTDPDAIVVRIITAKGRTIGNESGDVPVDSLSVSQRVRPPTLQID